MVALRASLDQWLQDYLQLNMGRDERLFTRFLPHGYAITTLSSVSPLLYEHCQLIKWMVGALITLSDDFTDNPQYRSSEWVKAFTAATQSNYQAFSLSAEQQKALKLGCQLYEWIQNALVQTTAQEKLIPLIEFDLQQYFLNMRFSACLNSDPSMLCKQEYLWYAPHNMGAVIAGMIDLACSDHVDWNEIALMRDVFYCAQRTGHICNTLTTLDRERAEGCLTNEIQLRMLQGQPCSEEAIIMSLREERSKLHEAIRNKSLNTFCVDSYVNGLQQFQSLHEAMQGII